jgi:hypothetical protein
MVENLSKFIAPLVSATGVGYFEEGAFYLETQFAVLVVENCGVPIDKMAFKAQDIHNALKKFGDGIVTMTDNAVVFSKGRSRLTVIPIAHTHKPLPGIISFLPLPGKFYPGLEVCTFNGNRSPYSGIYMDDFDMIATDGQKMCFCDLDAPMDKIWISDASAKLIQQYAFTEYHSGPEYLTLQGGGCRLAVKKLRADVYPVHKLLPLKQMTGAFEKTPVGIEEALKNALYTAVEDGIAKIHLTFKDNSVTVISDKRTGTYEETIEGMPLEGSFIGLYKHLQSIKDGDTIALGGPYLYIKRTDELIVITGMRQV